MPNRDPDDPFAEHPTGEFTTVLEAMEDAVRRLHDLAQNDRWITVAAQGTGGREDSYHIEEIRVLGMTIDLEERVVDGNAVCESAGLDRKGVTVRRDGGKLTLLGATPEDLAVFLDALFRTQLGIRGWPDQDNDYAVGFEW